jgi:hypothetical protein
MNRPLAFETLETRRLLTVIGLIGTLDPDHITIDIVAGQYRLDVNGTVTTHPLSFIDGIWVDGINSADNIDVRAAQCPVTVSGNEGDDTIRLGDGMLDHVTYPVTVNGDAGNDRLVLEDGASPWNDGYVVDRLAAWRTIGGVPISNSHVDYSELENITINASTGNNAIDVEQVPDAARVGMGSLVLNCSGGDDQVRLAPTNRNLDLVNANVTVVGGTGTNTLSLFDENFGGGEIYAITNTTVDWSLGGGVTYEGLADLTLNTTSAPSTINVNSTALGTFLTINAGPNNDTLRLGVDQLTPVLGELVFHGNGGTDSATLNDGAFTNPVDYVISDTAVTWEGLGRYNHDGVETVTLNAGSGSDGISMQTTRSFGTNFNLNAGAGADTMWIHETGLGTAATIDSGPGEDVVHVNDDATGFAGVVFASAQDLATLTMGAGARVLISQGGANALRTRSLAISPDATLNITNNPVIIDYTGPSPLAAIQSRIAQGYNGGDWLGGGISSSTAGAASGKGIGYAEATDLFTAFPATFAGQSIDASTVVLKYTYYGDANLDGAVNLADFNRLAGSFGGAPRRWSQGDFTYDLDVNLLDFNRLAGNFGLGGLAPGQSPDELLENLI